MYATHCTNSGVPWWQVFPIYKRYDNHRTFLRWGCSPEEAQQIYISPLVEAKQYSKILQHDPFVKTQTALAKEIGVSRVRITQVMNLLKLASKVQECLLGLQDQKTIRFFSERRLRPLIQIDDPKRQMLEFRKMLLEVHG